MKLALALICKGSDQEALSLVNCLENLHKHVDKIFVTITQKPGEDLNTNVKKICDHYKAEVSTFEWVNDFSAARNFNFSQVPKEYDYILWVDADDIIRGAEKIKRTIKDNPVDVYSMFYMYAFDEWNNPTIVHQKTQIVRNDGCVKWVGALHEDFKESRSLTAHFIKGIERIHQTNEERIKVATDRNIEVSKKGLKDKPEDPRSYWNLGNSLKMAGKNKEAAEALESFLKKSYSEEEKYIANLRLSEIYLELGDVVKSSDCAKTAIGTKPEYPDAYHLMGHILFKAEKFNDSIKYYLMGLTKKPPYYSIIVYNPRDYDYVPLMSLAKAYFNISMPMQALTCLEGCLKIYPKNKGLKEVIEKIKVEATKFEKVAKIVQKLRKSKDKDLIKAIDALPDEIRSHPAICHLRNTRIVKETSSGKDLSIYCGYTEKEWTPETAEKFGVGGSEEAVIHLSKGLVKLGWNVTVYNNCGYKELDFDGVKYKPFWSWNYRDKQDATIIWRSPKPVDYNINSTNVYIDLHDVISPGEFTEERLKKITKIFVKSNFHRSIFPEVSDDKFCIVPNGIDADVFKEPGVVDDNLIINTSSPDRSLSACVKIFKKVKEKIPEAKMKWAYGWDIFDIVHGSENAPMEWKKSLKKEMEECGIEELGRINHSEVAKLYKEASVFLYPTEFAEIDCISYSKALAAGAYPITTDFAALGEKSGYGKQFHSLKTKDDWCGDYQFDFSLKDEKTLDEMADAVVDKLRNYSGTTEMREHALKTWDWNSIVDKWNNELSKTNVQT